MNKFLPKLIYINSKQLFLIFLFLLVLVFSILISIVTGSFKISINDIFNGQLSDIAKSVFYEIRLPRVIFAAFVGCALSLSGACLQGLFRNPLADPGLIGVSSGAALGAASIIVLGSNFIPDFLLGPYLVPLSAIIGAMFVIFLLYSFTSGFGYQGITYMLLAGIAVNSIAGVAIGILTYISDDAALRSLTFWTMGSFGGITWHLAIPAITIIILNLIWIFRFSRKLDIIQLGESEAYRLGIDVKTLKFSVIISSAIIVGISVSISGMIGFVGLIVPHLIRLIGGVNHNYLLPSSALGGAILMVISDLISRTTVQPAELPIGLITSAIGSPFFLWLILKTKRI